MIWRYDDTARQSPAVNRLEACIYCGTRSGSYSRATDSILSQEQWFPFSEQTQPLGVNLLICPICGWWIVYRIEQSRPDGEIRVEEWSAAGALKNLDLDDISAPLDEAREYLVARYSDRYKVNAKLYEQVVGSVFRSLGYDALVTAYSGDGGIDVMILERAGGGRIGVQVKRQRDKIEAFQIRELTGALVQQHITRGIFVTTSSYTRGARQSAQLSIDANVPIELWDADRFYDALRLTVRPGYTDPFDPGAPFSSILQNVSALPKTRDAWLPTGW